jgi:hypothetical protein
MISTVEKTNNPEQGLTSPSIDPIVTAASGETTTEEPQVEAEKSNKSKNGKRALKVNVPKDINSSDH